MANNISILVEVVGLTVLIGFTGIMLFFALLRGGAVVYYWEPNVYIFLLEVPLMGLGMWFGFKHIAEVIRDDL